MCVHVANNRSVHNSLFPKFEASDILETAHFIECALISTFLCIHLSFIFHRRAHRTDLSSDDCLEFYAIKMAGLAAQTLGSH